MILIFVLEEAGRLSGLGCQISMRSCQVQIPLWPLAGVVLGSPWFNSSVILERLWPIGFLPHYVYLICIICFIDPEKPHMRSGQLSIFFLPDFLIFRPRIICKKHWSFATTTATTSFSFGQLFASPVVFFIFNTYVYLINNPLTL